MLLSHILEVWKNPDFKEKCMHNVSLNTALNNLKDNDKTTFSRGKFSWLLENKDFDNISNMNC